MDHAILARQFSLDRWAAPRPLARNVGANVAFNILVDVEATFTAFCWLLVPLLKRHASRTA
jgi:hypothetical protein